MVYEDAMFQDKKFLYLFWTVSVLLKINESEEGKNYICLHVLVVGYNKAVAKTVTDWFY
jgi:hypothetical protein